MSEQSFVSRPYENEDDLKQMLGLLKEARLHTDDWHYPHIGDLLFRFFILTCRADPREQIRLWYDAAGRLAGYAVLGGDDVSLDWQVLPEYEWRGIEDEAMAWAQARLADLVQGEESFWRGPFATRAQQDDAKRIAFIRQHGFARGEYSEVNMTRRLDGPVPAPILPAGYQLRGLAGPGDAPIRAAAYRDVWGPFAVGQIGDADYARLMQLPEYHCDLDIVALAPDGQVTTFVIVWLDPVNAIGELSDVGARPAYRRQGLTRAVLLEGLRRMQVRGMNRACVSTGRGNVAARQLYESIGFSVVNEQLEFNK